MNGLWDIPAINIAWVYKGHQLIWEGSPSRALILSHPGLSGWRC